MNDVIFTESIVSQKFVIKSINYAVCISEDVHCDVFECLDEAFEDMLNFKLDCLLYDI